MKTVEVTAGLTINENGAYRVRFLSGAKRHFAAEWTGPEGMTPPGTITLSFDGDPGESPGVLDLSGSRAYAANVALPFIDLTVTGFPADGEVTVYFN